MQKRNGNLHRALQMNEDDDSGGGDFFIDMVKTVLAVGFFLLFVCTIGAVLWGLIA